MHTNIKTKPFLLTMLGTDTNLYPVMKNTKNTVLPKKGNTVVDYPKGESLSLVSMLVQTKSDATESKTKDNREGPVPYKTDEVTVINGPTTTGSNVGEKIGLGLGETLLAIARGQQPINIIAHSRGAVESILIAHELQAIQDMIATCNSMEEVIEALQNQQTQRHTTAKPANNTPDIISHLKAQLQTIPQAQQAAWFESLKTNLPTTSINFFGIDPVPGDCFPITWYDDRYFTLPPIVQNAQILYYENEHSYLGFSPIRVDATTKEQKLTRYTMPGHHGTGSAGNNASQQKVIMMDAPQKTTHVQKLMLYKMLDFLNQHGIIFNDPAQALFRECTALGRKYAQMLEDATSEKGTIEVSQLDFPAIYRELYGKIAENRAAYQAYNDTSYTMMGIAPQRRMLRKGDPEQTGHTYGLLTDLFSISSGFVNDEHAILMKEHFFTMFQLDRQPESLAAIINEACRVLEENIRPLASEEQIEDLNGSYMLLNNPNTKLSDEATRDVAAKTFAIVIQLVSSQYLMIDWSSAEKQQEKQQFFEAITNLFSSFTKLSKINDETVQKFVGELTALSISGISDTLEQQYAILNKSVARVQESTDLRLQQFFQGVTAQFEQGKNRSGTDMVTQIMSSSEYLGMRDHPPELKIKHIIKQLEGMEDGLELVKQLKENLKLARTNQDGRDIVNEEETDIIAELSQNFVEQYTDNLETFAQLHQQIHVFMDDLNALSNLVPQKTATFSQYVLGLRQKSNTLVALAAQKCYCDRSVTELPPEATPGSFAELAERYAIQHYGVIDRVKAKEEALEVERQGLHQQVHALTQATLDLKKDLTIQVEKKEEFFSALNSEEEAKYLLLITQKLKPLTENYLQQLKGFTTDTSLIRQKKIDHLNSLLETLNATLATPKPSERVRAFYVKLNTMAGTLQEHRDPDWRRYVRNAVIAVGIMASAILPGLMFLAAYTYMTGKSARFWSSNGTQFVNELTKAYLPMPSASANEAAEKQQAPEEQENSPQSPRPSMF